MSIRSIKTWTHHIGIIAFTLVLFFALVAAPVWAAVAVGMIETRGFPIAVEAADSMVKAARVTLVGYEKRGEGRVTVIIRGDVSEVRASVAAGVDSAMRVEGGEILSSHIIARPHENLEYVLPIRYTEEVEQFRDSTTSIRPAH